MARKRFIGDLKRVVGKRPPNRKFIVFCEGKNTEPQYLYAFAAEFGALIDVDAIGGAGDPQLIAEKAVEAAISIRRSARSKKADSFAKSDEVWAMFDRDDHDRFQPALAICATNGIPVARSNPCFEVWLILHFEDFNRPVDRWDVMRRLNACCPEYDRNGSKTLRWRSLMPNVTAAEKRAIRILENRAAEGDAFGPPSTTVFQLTRRMREAAEKV